MPIKIIEIKKSSRPAKRYEIVINDGKANKSYHFGLEGGETYIDHQDKAKREAYRKRHYANKKEKELIDNLIPSPALFSYHLLWGNSSNLTKSIADLQKEFNRKKYQSNI